MIYNSQEFIHPSGFKLKTPLLIPSFSSKGFSIVRKKVGGSIRDVSELYDVILGCKELLTESMLVSAYDLYYSFIPSPQELHCTQFTFLDSGGYETSQLYDFSGINKAPQEIKKWELGFLEDVLKKWPEEYPAIIVNYDHGKTRYSLNDQIDNAHLLFNKVKDQMSDFLIKPETKEQNYIQMENVLDKISDFQKFDIIGVTEKEIGDSILNRMINISKIQKALESNGLRKPIHVFGSLDPITSILYFLAGAEIFDGLTWLKFSYHKGAAIYTHNYGVLNQEIGIHTRDSLVKIKSLTGNINFLDSLKYAMMDFAATKKFEEFHEIGGSKFVETIEKAYNRF